MAGNSWVVTGREGPIFEFKSDKWTTCIGVVCSDEFSMRAVLDAVTDMLCDDRIPDTIDGRFLAGGIARLVNTVVPGAIRVPDANASEGNAPP